jgi:hypothetical protein
MLLAACCARGQTLIHRYSFVTNANDSVGTANATLVNASTSTNGVVLNGTNAYISLPAGIITNLSAVTIETWASFGTISNNSFLFGFGNTDSSGDGEDYIFCTPHGSGTRAAVSGADPGYTGEQEAAISSTLDNQSNLMIATVFNPPSNYIGLYLNGALVASNTAVTTTMAAVTNKLSYLGHSLYTADPYLKGSILEFRIFNGALTNGQIAIDAGAGRSQIITNPGALQSWSVVSTNLPVGTTASLLLVGNFANVTNVNLNTYGVKPSITLLSGGNLVAVNSSGTLTALAPGTATLLVGYNSQFHTANVTATAPTNVFVFDTFNDGFWTITNAANGQALTVNASGASQETYTNGAPDQQFELLYSYANSAFRIRQRSSWQCLGTLSGGGATSNETPVAASSYLAASSQQWYLAPVGNGLYRILNLASPGYYALQTDNGSPANVTLVGASTNLAQLWGFSYQTHFPKKGTAGYEGPPYQGEFGTEWAYNYDDGTSASEPAYFDFVPMIYANSGWETVGAAQSLAPGWLAQPQPDYLLCYNEPDNTGSSPTSTNVVIGNWPAIEALNVPLVGPACQNTEDAWENSFYAMIAANNYRVDYAAIHEYVPPNSSSLLSDCQSVYSAYGRPVWLTEFSPVDWSGDQGWTEDDDYNFLGEFLWMAEGQAWFRRYAIFPFSGSNPLPPWQGTNAGYRGNTFESDGVTLTPYGELYATWDGITSLQTNTPYLIHNLGTSFRLTSTNSSTPQAADIYVRNSYAQWALVPVPTNSYYYIISLQDGRRLQNNGGTPALAPPGTSNYTCQWWFNGPNSQGYYYIDNVLGSPSQSIRATGTAPGISCSMVDDPAPSSATEWRLIRPYQPVTIVTALPPTVAISYTSRSATLTWTGNGSFYNVYRSTTSGGPYSLMAGYTTNSVYLDSGLLNGSAYYYVVTGLNILGQESAYSAQVVALPASTVPQSFGADLVSSSGQTGLQFSWAADHTGWRLLMNTNGLENSNAWFTVSNSAATNQVWLPLSPAQPSAFFRLVYP